MKSEGAGISKKWFTRGRRTLLLAPAAALALCLIGMYLTRGAMANLSFLRDGSNGLVDQRPWQTAQALAPLAVSAEEQNFAQEAERLADHEVDQAFAQALREASTQTKVTTGEALALSQKVAALEQEVKADQARVEGLTPAKPAAAVTAAGAAGTAAPTATANPTPDSDDIEIAKTQLQLDSDELSDAQENLQRATGDKRGVIQQELAERAAVQKKTATEGSGKTAVVSAKSRGTLAKRIGAWFDQRSRYALLLEAKRQADNDAAALTKQHHAVEKDTSAAAAAASASLQVPSDGDGSNSQIANPQASPPTPSAPQASTQPASAARPMSRSARLQLLRTLSEEHSILDDRIETQQELSKVYDKWAAQVERQHQIVLHLVLQSFALIAFIVLCAVLAMAVIDVLVERSKMDRRREGTIRTIAGLAVQVLSMLLVLLVIFGPPSQVPTILGLATAGVTVVFQDFILAFFGWFVLMGKNGISVGDWVEINSVGGEVVEISLFRTMLLETGNWTDKGHPTGRRVTFSNTFALTGQYFNFSTIGQWMWEEITLNIASGEAAAETIQAIRDRIAQETDADAHLAEEEWKRSSRQQGLSQFSAAPSVNLRPAAAGIDLIVRYVTRAANRFEMRNKIYQAMIEVLKLSPQALPAETKQR